MGLISGLLTLPLAPLRGTIAAAEQIRRVAEDELYDPARLRAELEAVEEAREAGILTDDEAADMEDEILTRLMTGREPGRT